MNSKRRGLGSAGQCVQGACEQCTVIRPTNPQCSVHSKCAPQPSKLTKLPQQNVVLAIQTLERLGCSHLQAFSAGR